MQMLLSHPKKFLKDLGVAPLKFALRQITLCLSPRGSQEPTFHGQQLAGTGKMMKLEMVNHFLK